MSTDGLRTRDTFDVTDSLATVRVFRCFFQFRFFFCSTFPTAVRLSSAGKPLSEPPAFPANPLSSPSGRSRDMSAPAKRRAVPPRGSDDNASDDQEENVDQMVIIIAHRLTVGVRGPEIRGTAETPLNSEKKNPALRSPRFSRRSFAASCAPYALRNVAARRIWRRADWTASLGPWGDIWGWCTCTRRIFLNRAKVSFCTH